MAFSSLIVLILIGVVAYFIWLNTRPNPILENMSGYGTISGLYFNNNAKYCFKNPYDPESYQGYCSIIGTVTR